MKVDIVFKEKYLQMAYTGVLKSEFTNVTRVIQDFEDEVFLIVSKPAKHENAEFKVGYPFDMISSISIYETENEKE